VFMDLFDGTLFKRSKNFMDIKRIVKIKR
jgi:hypothetical protein